MSRRRSRAAIGDRDHIAWAGHALDRDQSQSGQARPLGGLGQASAGIVRGSMRDRRRRSRSRRTEISSWRPARSHGRRVLRGRSAGLVHRPGPLERVTQRAGLRRPYRAVDEATVLEFGGDSPCGLELKRHADCADQLCGLHSTTLAEPTLGSDSLAGMLEDDDVDVVGRAAGVWLATGASSTWSRISVGSPPWWVWRKVLSRSSPKRTSEGSMASVRPSV